MSLRTFTLYRLADGLLGTTLQLPDDEDQLQANTPAGHGLIDGSHDGRTHRVDLASGELVPHRPPAPPDDADHTWSWSDELLRWMPVQTPARREREAAEQLRRRAAAIEQGQARAIRALLLNPNDAAARARLAQIEADIEALGLRRPAP